MFKLNRRHFIGHSARSMLTVLASTMTSNAFAAGEVFRFGLTPVISYKQSQTRDLMARYLNEILGVEVQFFERQKYREIVQMLNTGELDVAWLCGYPYVNNIKKINLIATPLFKHQPYYRSYLIARSDHNEYQSILDFEDKVFAFSDPDSLSGHIVPKFNLIRLNQNPEQFFRKTFYTYRHDMVIDAVVDGLADGGSVDSYVWETLKAQQDEKVLKTRIVCQSEHFAFPPIVSSIDLSSEKTQLLINAFKEMHLNPLGKELLKTLNLDGFKTPDNRLYDRVNAVSQILKSQEDI